MTFLLILNQIIFEPFDVFGADQFLFFYIFVAKGKIKALWLAWALRSLGVLRTAMAIIVLQIINFHHWVIETLRRLRAIIGPNDLLMFTIISKCLLFFIFTYYPQQLWIMID